MSFYRADSKYAFITGVIRAMEARMITLDDIHQLLYAKSAGEAFEILKNSRYFEFIQDENPADFRELLGMRADWLFSFIDKYSCDEDLNSLLKLEYDYHNLKVIIKEKLSVLPGKGHMVKNGTVPMNEFMSIFESGDFGRHSYFFKKAIDEGTRSFEAEKNIMFLEVAIDRIMFEDILSRATCLDSPLILNHVRLAIDLINIQSLFRIRKLNNNRELMDYIFIPGGGINKEIFLKRFFLPDEEVQKILLSFSLPRISKAVRGFLKNPFAIERECDNTLIDSILPARFFIWGIEPLYAFSFFIKMEIKILGFIFNGLEAGMTVEGIKDRVPGFH